MNELMTEFDSLSATVEEGSAQIDARLSRWADRLLLFSLLLFAASVPHSIAASNITLGLALLSWIARDVFARRIHFRRTPLDRALFCFAALTMLSALLSEARDISLPKLKSLTLFLILYVVAVNVSQRGVVVLLALVIASGLTGVAFSLAEKVIGRGLIVTAIRADSPLSKTHLQPGDVIWMLNRKRISSLSDLTAMISKLSVGQKLEIEALHNGDPLPLELIVTEDLKRSSDALRLEAGGRSRRFRVSGFSRQFLTYAEQMQILGLLAFGALLASLKSGGQSNRWLFVTTMALILFSTALVLTLSRAVLASFLLSLVLVAALAAGKRFALIVLTVALVTGSLGIYLLMTNRSPGAVSFGDDSSSRRIGYMKAGLRVIPHHPLFGVGLDAHKRFWREWNFPGDYITHTHSTPIQLALDRGLLALGCYTWLMATALLTAWRSYRKLLETGQPLSAGIALGLFAALVGFNFSSLFNYNFGDSELVLLLWFLMGLMLVIERQSGQVVFAGHPVDGNNLKISSE